MSDTTLTDPDAPPKLSPLVNYTLTVEVRGPAGNQAEFLTAKFGNPIRSLTIKPLTMGDQWDLAEITPAGVSDTWSNMAQVAYAVKTLDGVPIPPFSQRRNLRDTLDKLGVDGLRAASMALARVFDQSAVPDAVPAPDAALVPGAPDTARLDTAKNL